MTEIKSDSMTARLQDSMTILARFLLGFGGILTKSIEKYDKVGGG